MSNYAKAVAEMLKRGESVENLNKANHIALEAKKITVKEFCEAAQVLANAYLK